MGSVTLSTTVDRVLSEVRSQSAVLAVFAVTLFVSALLLFSVQPIFAKMVLPALGGSPSVWAVSMCFFQAMLLGGYCYAHALNKLVPARLAVLIHLLVCSIAMMALPFALPAMASEPPQGSVYLWLVIVLTLGVGLPFFAVSANAPLLQAWFARTGHPHANDPYFLYGASNLGSLIALLSYPLVIEPVIGLRQQAVTWTSGFIMLAILITAAGLLMLAAGGGREAEARSSRAAIVAPTSWADRLAWIGLAFVPSGLLVAFTGYITTDIASAPFLWVIPLAAFLATFILVFRDPAAIAQHHLLKAQPIAVGAMLVLLTVGPSAGLELSAAVGFAAFFITTMVCHRTLYERRPDSAHLTEFYLWMSLGGVLGGVFAAIVAPQIFSDIYEWPLLLVAGLLCRAAFMAEARDPAERREAMRPALMLLAVAAVVVALVLTSLLPAQTALQIRVVLACAGAGMMVAVAHQQLRLLALGATLAVLVVVMPAVMSDGTMQRSFFGVLKVKLSPDKAFAVMEHGTTVHGAQRVVGEGGNRVFSLIPATYYYPGGPIAGGIDVARSLAAADSRPANIAIVGLGTGALACYARPGETWSYHEIDPLVVSLARNPKHFTYLASCGQGMPIAVGDARLTLAKEPVQSLDYLLIDAFSSDSVPVHLLTREALELYLSRVTAGGLVALHISNRHMDLAPVGAATAAEIPGAHIAVMTDPVVAVSKEASSSKVLFLSRSKETIDKVLAAKGAAIPKADGVAPWTDDYSNVLAAILRGAGDQGRPQ